VKVGIRPKEDCWIVTQRCCSGGNRHTSLSQALESVLPLIGEVAAAAVWVAATLYDFPSVN
jgi:hypothetical protein